MYVSQLSFTQKPNAMKLHLITLLLLASAIAQAQYTYDNLDLKTELTPQEQSRLTYEKLRLYPIYAKESFIAYHKYVGKYTPLKTALEKNLVKITETSTDNRNGSPTVNTLYIENASKDTIYLMSGEVITGGKQDRVVAQDVVLPPKSGRVSLSVFCVEHGRWTYNSPSNSESFNGTIGTVSNSVRKAADREQNQSEVWSEVAKANTKNGTETQTGTYKAMDNNKEYTEKRDKYVSYFKTQLGNEQNLIGLVAASGDKVIGCDMFATTTLFSEQLDNLLQAYVTEAILNGDKVTVSNATMKAYADKLLSSEQQQKQTLEKDGKSFKKEDKTLHISVY